MESGSISMITSISNPTIKNIKITDFGEFKNFLSFKTYITLPIKPARTVEIEQGIAVGPPIINLNIAEITAEGMPTIGPPNKDPISMVMVRTLAKESPLGVNDEEIIPKNEKTSIQQIKFLREQLPSIISLNGFKLTEINIKIKEIAKI